MADVVEGWLVPSACTLPTAERPLRLREFDDLFAEALRGQSRLAPSVLRWVVDPDAEATTRDLTARESECCSFFVFDISTGADKLVVEVRVPATQIEVLDALQARAAAGLQR